MERDRIDNWARVGIGISRSAAEIAEGDGCVCVNPESDARFRQYWDEAELLDGLGLLPGD